MINYNVKVRLMAAAPSGGEDTWTVVNVLWTIGAAVAGAVSSWLGFAWTTAKSQGQDDGEIAEWRKSVEARLNVIELRKDKQDLRLEQMSERLAMTPTRQEFQAMCDRFDAKLDRLNRQ